jgi:hypothetical protein
MRYQEPVGADPNDPYINGDASTGTEGSIPPAAAIEHPMREIVHVIEQMGITPDAADLTQLYQALGRLSGRGVTTLTAAGSPAALGLAEAGLVLVDASAGDVDLTLPAAAGNGGLRYTLMRTDGAANTATVTPDGADTIEGAATLALAAGDRRVLVSDSTGTWRRSEPLASETLRGMVELATAAEAQGLTDPLRALTPATLAAAFQGGNQSLADFGYQILPGGLILQWGQFDMANDYEGGPVYFPTTFPNLCWGVAIGQYTGGSESDAGRFQIRAGTLTRAQFYWNRFGANPSTGVSYWAFGG